MVRIARIAAELIKLDITDVTQMVCGVIVGSLVWKLGSLTPTDVRVNHWSAPFVKLFKRSSNNSVGRYS